MTVTPWLANYPFSDPIFQNFNVQQYLTQAGVNPAQTYSLEAPAEAEDKPEPKAPARRSAPKAPAAKPKADPQPAADSEPATAQDANKTEDK